MRLAIEDHESCIEVLLDGNVPVFARADDHGMKALRNGDNCICFCKTRGIPGFEAHHIGIEEHYLVMVNKIEYSQLQMMRIRKT